MITPGLPYEINLYLEVALSGLIWNSIFSRSMLLTEQDLKSIGGVCMHIQ